MTARVRAAARRALLSAALLAGSPACYGLYPYLGPVETDPPAGATRQIVAGRSHTCALRDTGTVRCWGKNGYGQLGHGNREDIGDDETPASAGDVDVGGPVRQIAVGGYHTCALLETGAVRCWGDNSCGQLGYGHTEHLGDDPGESPAAAGDVDVGGPVRDLALGHIHTCALLETGAVRCWGQNRFGQLGYGHRDYIGDDETPAGAGEVDAGGEVLQLAAGVDNTCALLATGAVRCWGNALVLGSGSAEDVGDDEPPSAGREVELGGLAVEIAARGDATCAVLEGGAVRCWGFGRRGALGYGNTEDLGAYGTPSPAEAGDVDVGGPVRLLAPGDGHTCALLESGAVRCWGDNLAGQLGYGHTRTIGDDESPASAGAVPLGGRASQLTAGAAHTCAVLASGVIRCWGYNAFGQLGYGHTRDIGDDEGAASGGDVRIW